MIPDQKYILDPSDLQYKRVRISWRKKILRFMFWFALSIGVSIIYFKVFTDLFGSPKEKLLSQQVDNIKLQYSLLNRKFSDAFAKVEDLQQSDDICFRPILNMDSLPFSYRNPGYGGVDRYREFSGLANSSLIISSREKIDALKNMSKVQEESFKEVKEQTDEWLREQEYFPRIRPVDPGIPLGDGFKLREVHPIYGTPKWHFGQDFSAPYGTEVYATGAGKVIFSGWNADGFGYHVIIDHGYGIRTIYGHLSKIDVPYGANVKRGELIGLSGNSGTSSGPHLHYQVDVNGSHQNALNFFSDDLTQDEYTEMINNFSSKSKFR